MNPIAQLILGVLPNIVQMVKDAHKEANPDAPAITSAEVIQGLEDLTSSTLAKDQALRVALQAEIDAQG